MSATKPKQRLRSKQDWALEMAMRGLLIFPLRPNSKQPYEGEKWTEVMTRDADTIRAWFADRPDMNFGVCGGEHHAIVDLDRKADVDGVEAFGALELANGLVESFAVATPSGGRHLYLKTPEPVSNSHSFPNGIDVRGARGYVVGPGCTFQGRAYRVSADTAITDAPSWVIGHLNRKANTAANREPTGALDTPGAVARAREFLKHRDPAVEGLGGDSHTFATAQCVIDLGISEAKALDLMADEFNPRCEPPWEVFGAKGTLEEKIRNAWRYRERAPGSKGGGSGSDLFGDLSGIADIADLAENDNKPIEGPISFSEVLRREPSPVEEILPGLIEKGVTTFLAGPGGSNKSRLALQIGLCVNAGKSIFGKFPKPATLIYLSSEDGPDEITRRAHAITRRLDLPEDTDGQYWDCTGGISALALMREGGIVELLPFYERLHDHLLSVPGHKLVVLDSCYDYAMFAGNAKIDEGAVNAFIKRVLDGLCVETDSSLIVVWHPSQAGMERGDATGWSVAWNNAPRARLSMRPLKDTKDAYMLKVEKRNHGPTGAELTLHWADGALLQLDGLADREQKDMLAEACVAMAIECAEQGMPIQGQKRLMPWQMDRIEERCEVRPTDREVKNLLSKAAHDGMLVYLSGNKYRSAGYYPPEKAEELAKDAKKKGARSED